MKSSPKCKEENSNLSRTTVRNKAYISTVFNKISDISDTTQISHAMNLLKNSKERCKLLDLIMKRKQEIEEMTQFMRFHDIRSILQKLKNKIKARVELIRERKKENQTPLLRKKSLFSPMVSPKSRVFQRKESISTFSFTDNSESDFTKILKNPKTVDIVMRLYRAMHKNKKTENTPLINQKSNNSLFKLDDSQTKNKFLKVVTSIHGKNEFDEYKEFMVHIKAGQKNENFDQFKKENLQKIKKIADEKKIKNARKQLESDLYSFCLTNLQEKENFNEISDFFGNEIKNKQIRKVEDNVKEKLAKILNPREMLKNHGINNSSDHFNKKINHFFFIKNKNEKQINLSSFNSNQKHSFGFGDNNYQVAKGKSSCKLSNKTFAYLNNK